MAPTAPDDASDKADPTPAGDQPWSLDQADEILSSGEADAQPSSHRRYALVVMVLFVLYLTVRMSMANDARILRHRFGRTAGTLAWLMANPIDSLLILSPIAYAIAPYITNYQRDELLNTGCILQKNRHMSVSGMMELMDRHTRHDVNEYL